MSRIFMAHGRQGLLVLAGAAASETDRTIVPDAGQPNNEGGQPAIECPLARSMRKPVVASML
jgi:hypothetical protein